MMIVSFIKSNHSKFHICLYFNKEVQKSANKKKRTNFSTKNETLYKYKKKFLKIK